MTPYRLGRKALLTDTRTLKLERYFTDQLPAAPAAVDWTQGMTSFGSLLNDSLGDCTIAGVGHAIQIFTANTGSEAAVTDAEALQYYEEWDGYNPAIPGTDQGGIELDVLKKWRAQGFAGHTLDAFADVAPTHTANVCQGIALFGGVYIGIAMPLSAQEQIGSVWDVSDGVEGEPGSWGGHCVFVPAYDADGLTCITWGSLQRMTWNFWRKYVDEVHTLISPDFIRVTGLSPSGFDLAALQLDLSQIV